jgi:FHA domain-containing protein
MTENDMETLLDYMAPKALGRDHFVAEFSHPFLLWRGETLERRRNVAFDTDLVSSQISHRHLSALNLLRARGQRLAPNAERIFVFKIKKRADGAFRDNISIGRTAQCDICIPDRHISKLHAYVQCRHDGDYVLFEGNSTNGTIVNGKRLEHGQPHTLRTRDVIELTPFRLEFVNALSFFDLLHQSVIAMDVPPDVAGEQA